MLPFIFLLFFPSFTFSLNQEGLYLYQLKLSLSDSDSNLASWSDRHDNPCSWPRVQCDPATRSVTSLNLSDSDLAGPFPSALCRLRNLTFLSLYNNSINQTLPHDISTCQSLRHLDLAQNFLTGALPDTLPDIPNLTYLDLTGNNFFRGDSGFLREVSEAGGFLRRF